MHFIYIQKYCILFSQCNFPNESHNMMAMLASGILKNFWSENNGILYQTSPKTKVTSNFVPSLRKLLNPSAVLVINSKLYFKYFFPTAQKNLCYCDKGSTTNIC